MSSLFFLSYVFLSLFIPSTHALVGCDATGCPIDSNKNTLCVLGDKQLTAVGIDNFTAPLASEETLTWTLGERSYVTESDARLEQNFYLGTPPSLQLYSQSAYAGCALIFKDAANNLSFLGSGSNTPLSARAHRRRSTSDGSPETSSSVFGLRGNGTCSDAMGSPCINALMAQAKNLMSMNNITGPYDDNLCQRFASALQNAAPKNCSVAGPSGSWGEIIGKSLFASNASQPVTQDSCHPTTGQGYGLSLVSSFQRSLTTSATFHSGFRGVVPVLTMIFPTAGSNKASPQKSNPAPALSCLAPVGLSGNTYSSAMSNDAGDLRPRSPWMAALVVVVGAVALLPVF